MSTRSSRIPLSSSSSAARADQRQAADLRVRLRCDEHPICREVGRDPAKDAILREIPRGRNFEMM